MHYFEDSVPSCQNSRITRDSPKRNKNTEARSIRWWVGRAIRICSFLGLWALVFFCCFGTVSRNMIISWLMGIGLFGLLGTVSRDRLIVPT